MENQDTTFRPLEPADFPFVGSSWIKSLTMHSSGTRRRDVATVVTQLLQLCGGTALVARERPDFLLGYAIHEHFAGRDVLHWLYVKHSFRQLGCGGKLLREALGRDFISVTMAPQPVTSIANFMGKYCSKWEYNPYLLARRMIDASKGNLHAQSSPEPDECSGPILYS